MSRRRFILELPGPASYCSCDSICSGLEIEHVLPKSFIKRRTSPKKFSQANRDPHNLFSCCQILNREKSHFILGVDYDAEEHNGRLARACLHMNAHYNLGSEDWWVKVWNNYSLLYPPEPTEYARNRIIYEKTGVRNKYIEPI